MSKAREKDGEIVFETGMERLEELIEELEKGELDLDRSLAVFEEGIRLSRLLNRKLDEAEKKLDMLVKNEYGGMDSQSFLPENGDGEDD